jgi:hypothetical protein
VTLQGLKAIAAELERLARERRILIGEVTEVRVFKLATRRTDPLPTWKQRGRNGGRMADNVAIASWFDRQRFAFSTDERVSCG